MGKRIVARAPGKLILTGEYAVTQGNPAIAFAIDRYLITTVTRQSPPEIMFDLVNLPHKGSRTIGALRRVANRAQDSFHRFQQGKAGIRDVIRKPFELMEYTTSRLIDKFSQELQQGVRIRTESNIPTGSGMGSSAASIVSATHALSAYFGRELSDIDRHAFHLETENLQHGRSSGIDIYLSQHGGVYYFTSKTQQARMIWDLPLWIVNTGTPECTTGECSVQVRNLFEQKPSLIKQFATVTKAIDTAWQAQDIDTLKASVNTNQQLLVEIGVVPAAVQKIIATITQQGLAAKVCGAGAIRGDHAGMVLVIGGKPEGVDCEQVHIVKQGVELIDD